jgi:hypothetical protein
LQKASCIASIRPRRVGRSAAHQDAQKALTLTSGCSAETISSTAVTRPPCDQNCVTLSQKVEA